MSGFSDFFQKLFTNLKKNDSQRTPMLGRGGFGVQRPQGAPGVIGGGGAFSGQDPNDPYLYHLSNSGDNGQMPRPTTTYGNPMTRMLGGNQGDQPDEATQIVNNMLADQAYTGGGADSTVIDPRQQYGKYDPNAVAQAQSPADAKYNEIMGLLNRDYSKKKDAQGNVVYGKDYDKTHNWKDIWRGIGLGALQGGGNVQPGASLAQTLGSLVGGAAGGGISTGVDRNADNKMLDQLKLQHLLPEYQTAYGLQRQRTQDQLADALKQAQTATIGRDDARQQADLERKITEGQARAKYNQETVDFKNRSLNWKSGDRDKWFDLQEKKLKAVQDHDGAMEKIYQERQDELERSNKVKEKQAVTRETGRNTRAQLAIEARKALADFNAAQAKGRAQDAAAARERLAQLKAQYEGLDETPQQ